MHPPGGASSYQLQCRPETGDAVTIAGNIPGTEYAHRNPDYETDPGAYRVRAVRVDLPGSWSEWVSPGHELDRQPRFAFPAVSYAWTVGQAIGAVTLPAA